MLDFTPDDYAYWHASNIGKVAEDLEQSLIFSLLGDLRGLKVLDVGCGDGTYAKRAVECGAIVQGIDTSRASLLEAEKQSSIFESQITWTVGDVRALPFQNESFDCVIAVTVLCLLPVLQTALSEMNRVLKPGGLLVVGELNRWSLWAFHRRIKGWLNSSSPWRQVKFRSAHDWSVELIANGFNVKEIRGCIYFPPWFSLARIFLRFERRQGRREIFGPAFIALSARKKTNPNNTIKPGAVL